MSRALIFILIVTCAAVAGCAAPSESVADLPDSTSADEPQAAGAHSAEAQARGTRAAGTPLPAAQVASVSHGPSMTTVPEGTVIEVRLASGLNSGTNRAGDAFAAAVAKDVMVDGRRAIPAGSTVSGIVKSVTPAKRGAGNASLSLAFNSLELPDESSVPIVAGFSGRTASKKKHDAAVIGGSAAGGALLGRLIGKDTKGAVVGALAGGAVGTGVVMSKEGDQVNLAAGATLSLRLEQSVRVPRR